MDPLRALLCMFIFISLRKQTLQGVAQLRCIVEESSLVRALEAILIVVVLKGLVALIINSFNLLVQCTDICRHANMA